MYIVFVMISVITYIVSIFDINIYIYIMTYILTLPHQSLNKYIHTSWSDRIENVWLAINGQVSSFCITSTFQIENTIVTPPDFVVADKSPPWIGTNSGLS